MPECVRCGINMRSIGVKKLQLGKTGWLLGDLPNLVAGALEVEIFLCGRCGKLEFFQPEAPSSGISRTLCPECGGAHDMDFPKCPYCGHDYR